MCQQSAEESENVVADFELRVAELEGQLGQRELQSYGDMSEADGKTKIKLRWREGENMAPFAMSMYCDAVVRKGVVYCKEVTSGVGNDRMYAYHTTTHKWSLIPHCPVYRGFTLANVNGTLATVGGYGHDGKDTNKLFSLTAADGENREKSWIEDFPPMPTQRCNVSTTCTGTALIVVGGEKGDGVVLKTVEILDTSTQQWYIATELPQALSRFSMTVCGDRIYLLGGKFQSGQWTQSVYSCSLSTLLMSHRSRIARALSLSCADDAWIRVSDIPVIRSTAVSLHGQLIAVGGDDSDNKPTSDIRRFVPSTNSWEVIGHMAIPRCRCLAAAFDDNQLMVTGGWDNDAKEIDSVEFCRVEIR